MSKTVVGVVRGGTSAEYEHSLKTGAAILRALDDRFETRDIFIDRSGVWHVRGTAGQPYTILRNLDVIFNALHGGEGEGGTDHRLLEKSGIPYTGSIPSSSALAKHKIRAREYAAESGVSLPQHYVVRGADRREGHIVAREIFSQFGPPYIVKPVSGGAGIGVFVVPTIFDLEDILAPCKREEAEVLVEEYVRGDEMVVGILNNFREAEVYALPPVLLRSSSQNTVYQPHLAASGAVQFLAPAPLTRSTKEKLEEVAKHIHTTLDLSHSSTSDFKVHPTGRVYYLETDAQPHVHFDTPLMAGLDAVGATLSDYAHHMVALAQART
jgi:D-alanine-D-alanine ligase